MAGKNLKGLTIKIGGDTTELTKALDKVEKQGSDLSGELKQINNLLKFDPKDTQLLAQKQKVLAEAIGTAEDKLKTLKEAETQVQAQFARGEVSEAQYRALQREIIFTEGKLKQYKKAAQETADAVEDLGKDVQDSAEDLDKQADSADDANDAIKTLGDGAATVAKVGLATLAGAVAAVAGGIKSVVDETAEYRREMAKLDTAYEKSGHSSEAAYETYSELQSVLGESDQAVEAANFIAKLAKDEEELAKWTEVCTGIYGEFGSSLPIEGLVESANETAKTGQIAGSLADALNWAASEGETFGVALKENIEFTKLSEKELSKLTDAQKEEYKAREKQYTEIEEYNKKVAEAKSAEDFFNIALENCTTEQERQALILETLNGKYSDSVQAFRENNTEVIKQNQASERLNKTWAQVGKKAAPIVTTFTEGVAELAEAFLELIEDADIDPLVKGIQKGFKNLSEKVLPKLIKALEWCGENFDLLKSLAVGFIAALAVAKIASFTMKVGTTLVGALKSLTKAQLASNAAANANPYMLLASVIVGLTAAVVTYAKSVREDKRQAMEEAAQATYGLTEAEEKLIERIEESSTAFQSQRKTMDEGISGINSQFDHLGKLKDELLRLVDAEGRVDEKNRGRVDFILTQLNGALGTEYERVGDLISNYDTLKDSIDHVLLSKQTELLLGQGEEAYATAIKGRQQAETDFYAAVIAMQEQRAEATRLQAEYDAIWGDNWEQTLQEMTEARDGDLQAAIIAFNKRREQYNADVEAHNSSMKDKEKAYKDSKAVLEGYYTDIGQYETAYRLSLEGNNEVARKVLSDRAYYMEKYADEVGFNSDEIQNSWELTATEAGLQAKNIKKNFEDGVEGYTEGMVTESQESYDAVLEQLGNAYTDYKSIGEDMTDGMVAGLEQGKAEVVVTAIGVVNSAFKAAQKALGINSPSKEFAKLGRYSDEGLVVGFKEGEGEVMRIVDRQVQGILSAYDGLRAPAGQHSLNAISEAAANRTTTEATTLASVNQPMLEKILVAIERGQIVTIDGDAVVGATAGRMDTALGHRRALAARGAI